LSRTAGSAESLTRADVVLRKYCWLDIGNEDDRMIEVAPGRCAPIRVITFDLDNTLWDVAPVLMRAEEAQRAWLLRHRPGTMDRVVHADLWELRKTLRKAHPELSHNVTAMRKLLLRELQLAAGYNAQQADQGADAAFAALLRERYKVELYAQALEVLEQLSRDYRLGALTNGNADVYRTDAGEYFDFAFLAEEIGASKPAPDMFHAALETTGVQPKEVVHVGDSPEHDVLGARQIGMRTIWVNLNNDIWQHNDRPDETIRHIGELPAAIERIDGKAC
jgi:putative hydrolase of the HAD superfamily